MSKSDDDKFPCEEEALELLNKYGVDKNIIEHSKAVCKKALEIAEKIIQKGLTTVNIGLIRASALLHDIGRYNENSIRHGVVGGELIRKLGYSSKLARIVERHVLCGISERFAKKFEFPNRKFIPETVEELIICYADKLVAGRRVVDLKKRFSYWIRKYGRTQLLDESIRRTKRVEKKVLELMGNYTEKNPNK
ncbi:HDIG domain-containing metalloprotein [Candidatus Borrarchaeum sp.]|uniref:HDIG domain-containing metalloprotein n=1 Tax=Candidatus Borrarchaeum sp. TaxID=2846742 RepID=UPI00257EC645|nr:HDIG domain-containing metalloprotein [Candidatus Borrarchaeum sp.]